MIDRAPHATGDSGRSSARRARAAHFVVEYARPSPALASWGMHVLEAPAGEHPTFRRAAEQKPVGTARTGSWSGRRGKSRLRRQPDYFEGKPYIARVITRHPDRRRCSRAQVRRRDIMTLTPPQYVRQTETAEFKKSFNRYKYTASDTVPWLPLSTVLPGQAGPAGDRPRGGQEGADRRVLLGWAGGDGPYKPEPGA